jgi:hypothetical protein
VPLKAAAAAAAGCKHSPQSREHAPAASYALGQHARVVTVDAQELLYCRQSSG